MPTIVERRNDKGQVIGFQARVRRRGHPVQSKTFTRKTDAERWARQLESEMERGVFVDRSEAERNTLGDLLKRYMDEVTPTHKGEKQERQRLLQLARDPLCARSVATLKSKDFAQYRDDRLQQVSAGTVIRELNLWHAILETGRREWGIHLAENPVSLVRRPKADPPRERRLVDDEEARLYAACDRDPVLGPLVRLAVQTGMRQGELLALRWNDIDFDRKVAVLHDTKNGDRRVVPLSSAAREVLDEMARRPRHIGNRVFFIDNNVVKMRFRRACKAAGIEGLRFHDLRHEATSRFFEHGLGMMEVAAITGHKTLAMLKRYTHLAATDLAEKLG